MCDVVQDNKIVASRNAYAKINLFLHIIGKDELKSKHLIESLCFRSTLSDIIEIDCSISDIERSDCTTALQNSLNAISCELLYDTSLTNLASSTTCSENIVITTAKKVLHHMYKHCTSTQNTLYMKNTSEGCAHSHYTGNIVLDRSNGQCASTSHCTPINDRVKWLTKLHVKIRKFIPMSAGLGGGSADAAAVLSFLSNIFYSYFNMQDMHDLAASIGADVMFAISGYGAAIVSGVGERIRRVEISENLQERLILVNRGFAVSTACVYAEFDRLWGMDHSKEYNYEVYNNITPTAIKSNAHDSNSSKVGLSKVISGRNDLMNAACNLHRELSDVLSIIKKCNNCEVARMSGSGGTLFGIFSDKYSALNAVKEIKRTFPLWWIYHADV